MVEQKIGFLALRKVVIKRNKWQSSYCCKLWSFVFDYAW